jgi:hypothetical protein
MMPAGSNTWEGRFIAFPQGRVKNKCREYREKSHKPGIPPVPSSIQQSWYNNSDGLSIRIQKWGADTIMV